MLGLLSVKSLKIKFVCPYIEVGTLAETSRPAVQRVDTLAETS